MDEQVAAGQRLVGLATPFLARDNRDGLARVLHDGWSVECLTLLLDHSNSDVIETAAHCIGLVGDASCLARLAKLLHHSNDVIVQAAEDAMWCIGFRAGTPLEHKMLLGIAQSIRNGDSEHSAALLKPLIKTDRPFAEAFHQRGQAHYLNGAYAQSLRDADRTIRINPYHFAAHALRANCLAALHRDSEALDAYRRVLQIHPHFYGARDAIHCLQQRLAGTNS